MQWWDDLIVCKNWPLARSVMLIISQTSNAWFYIESCCDLSVFWMFPSQWSLISWYIYMHIFSCNIILVFLLLNPWTSQNLCQKYPTCNYNFTLPFWRFSQTSLTTSQICPSCLRQSYRMRTYQSQPLDPNNMESWILGSWDINLARSYKEAWLQGTIFCNMEKI